MPLCLSFVKQTRMAKSTQKIDDWKEKVFFSPKEKKKPASLFFFAINPRASFTGSGFIAKKKGKKTEQKKQQILQSKKRTVSGFFLFFGEFVFGERGIRTLGTKESRTTD